MSSRQKMINVMYLVLLAILALNVDAEVLNAFLSLRQKLSVAVSQSTEQNQQQMQYMLTEIDNEIQNQGKRSNEGLIDTLSEIRLATGNLLNEINTHMQVMEKMADFDSTEQVYTRMDELERNYAYWMGTDEMANGRRGNGKAKELKDQLDGYFSFIHQMYQAQITEGMEVEKRELETPKSLLDPGKQWEQHTFEGPVVANVAILEALKMDIRQEEKRLLDLLSQRLRQFVFTPDTVVPISAPTARIVPAGLNFQTQLFIGMSSRTIKPEFQSSQGRITLENQGNTATLQIAANPSVIPQGAKEGRQRYQATILVPKATGGFEELTVQDEFIVRKPEVVVSSASVQILYRNCGNQLKIDVPALGTDYRPTITARGGSVKSVPNKLKEFMIIPTQTRCQLNVSSQTQGQTLKLDQLNYKVIAPPKPEILVKVNGRIYSGGRPIPRASSLQFLVKPDADFKANLPRDARYRVGSIEIFLDDGIGVPRKVSTINTRGKNPESGINVYIPTAVRQAGRGAKFFAKLNDIQRINFDGEAVSANISERAATFSFTIR